MPSSIRVTPTTTTHYLYYKAVSSDDILNFIKTQYPSATVVGGNIVFEETPDGHQAGDEYAIRIIQADTNNSSTVGTTTVSGVTYNRNNHYDGFTQTGEFSEPDVYGDVYTDTNLVGRKIKFLLQPNVGIAVWAENISVTVGQIVYSDNKYYRAESTGTTGSVQPNHTSGTVSDGHIDWTYIHSGTATATIISVEDEQNLIANVDGETLPILQSGQASYTWKYYQWSMWGYKQRYPNQVFFYKGRLGYFVSTVGYGCWLNLSKSDDFNDFGTETFGENLDTDAIVSVMSGHPDNNVNWVLPGERLYCGSYSGEYNVSGEKNGPITPINANIQTISTIGGAPVAALKFRELNLFVAAHSNEIYSISYDYTTDDYVPTDIGIMSQHLLEDKITRWDALNNEDRNIYFHTGNNKVNLINYVKDTKTLGYYRLNLNGEILDLAASNAGPLSRMCFLVKRGDVYTLELSDNIENGYMIDRHQYDFEDPQEQIIIEDLANKEVYVKNRDTGEFYKTVIAADGVVRSKKHWQHFDVGLPMVCTFNGNPMTGEKLEGLQQKSTSFTVRLRESGAFRYGTSHDFSRYYEYSNWDTCDGQQYNAAHDLITGDIELPAPSGYMQKNTKCDTKYPNDTGIALNLQAETPEPFNLLMISNVYV